MITPRLIEFHASLPKGHCLFHLIPCLVRVILCYCLCNLFRLWPEVLLKHNTQLVHREGHDPGHTVLRRVCHQAEASHHLAVDYIIQFTTGSIAALTFQDLEIIPVVR